MTIKFTVFRNFRLLVPVRAHNLSFELNIYTNNQVISSPTRTYLSWLGWVALNGQQVVSIN